MAKAAAAKPNAPRRNIRLKKEERPQGEAGFSFKLFKFFLKKFMLLIGLAVLTLFFILAYDFATQTRLLGAKEMEFSGNKAVSNAELLAAAEFEPNGNLLNINTAHMRQRLLTLDWVKEAEVKRRLPHKFFVEIVEHEPLICADLGQIFLVNREGYVFKPALAENTARMPTVRGLNIPAEYWVDAGDFCLWTATRGISPLEVNKIKALQTFLHLCENNPQTMGLALISDIETDGLTGLTAIMRNGRVVKFGFGDLKTKFNNYARFAAYAARDLGAAEIQTVDLRDAARIVVKKANS